MSRIAFIRRVLAAVTLLALLAAPMASARTLVAPSIDGNQDGWLGATLRWIEDLVSPRHPGRRPGPSGPQAQQHQKVDNTTSGAGCIDPVGHPSPWCGV